MVTRGCDADSIVSCLVSCVLAATIPTDAAALRTSQPCSPLLRHSMSACGVHEVPVAVLTECLSICHPNSSPDLYTPTFDGCL